MRESGVEAQVVVVVVVPLFLRCRCCPLKYLLLSWCSTVLLTRGGNHHGQNHGIKIPLLLSTKIWNKKK